jgi:hypothetical protein
MKILILSALLVLLVLPGVPQTLKQNDELKFNADYFLMRQEFDKALDLYLRILRTEPENADIKYRIGICYLNSDDEKDKSIRYLQEASEHVTTRYNVNSFKEIQAPIETYFLLGSAYRVNNQLPEAIAAYQKYEEYLDPKDKYNRNATEQYIENCRRAGEMMKKPRQITFTNLGKVINNSQANFDPVVSGDGKTLVFTCPGRQGYDIYLSYFNDTAWSVPKNITSVLGAGKYMRTSSLSFDGTTLILDLEDPDNSDLYISHFKKGRWSRVEPMSKVINSKYNETNGSLSPDGKTLYFTSNRKGGEGDLDIYRSVLQGEVWSNPQNLGPGINTPYNEETPFVSSDGNVLYFSSEGHDGIGGYDIFKYDFNHPEKGAVNLGYPINTTDNNLFYVPVGDGSTGFYSYRGPDSFGGRDIYKVTIEEPVEVEQPLAVAPTADTVTADTAQVVQQPATVADTTVAGQQLAAVPDTVTPAAAVVEQPAAAVEPEPVPPAVEVQPAAVEVQPAAVVKEQPAVVVEEQPAVIPEENVAVARSFTIQFMALRKPVDLKYFTGLSDISVTFGPDAWYRYTCMTTTDSIRANNMRDELIKKGYADAFIRRKGFIPRFTIQVMAVPGPVTDLNAFSNLPEISVRKGNDKFCRYTTGWFEHKEEALMALKQVKSIGYSRAFVRRFRWVD